MDRSTGRNPVEGVSTNGVAAPDLILGQMPTIDFFPADVVRHRTARWRGVRARTMQIVNHAPVEYRFKQQYHLLIAVEQGVYGNRDRPARCEGRCRGRSLVSAAAGAARRRTFAPLERTSACGSNAARRDR
jgi:hypothetical protein